MAALIDSVGGRTALSALDADSTRPLGVEVVSAPPHRHSTDSVPAGVHVDALSNTQTVEALRDLLLASNAANDGDSLPGVLAAVTSLLRRQFLAEDSASRAYSTERAHTETDAAVAWLHTGAHYGLQLLEAASARRWDASAALLQQLRDDVLRQHETLAAYAHIFPLSHVSVAL